MNHVEIFITKCSKRSELRCRIGCDWGDRPVGNRRKTRPEGCDPRVRRRTIAGAKHPCIAAASSKRSSKSQNLPLHPTGHGETIGANNAYT